MNIGDLLDNRPGGIVRGEGAPGDAFGTIPTQPIPQTAWQMQEWLSTKLESRTGFTRYSQGMDADSLNKTATGINIITSKSDMRLRLMTRFAAQGVRKMFAKLLKLATKHQSAQDWFDVNGEWVPVSPTEWRDQFNIKINVGLGHGTKEQQAQRVMAMLPLQMQGLQLGIVRPEQIASTIRLFAQVNEFKNPDEFADAQPAGPTPQMQQLQQQMQEMQGQLQQVGQENAQLKVANANKEREHQLKAMEIQSKHAIATQPEATEPPADNSIEWAKVRIAEFDAVTKRMALGVNADEAEREFMLSHAIAQHDAAMDIAAHEQADNQFSQQAAMDAAQATDGPAASNEGAQ